MSKNGEIISQLSEQIQAMEIESGTNSNKLYRKVLGHEETSTLSPGNLLPPILADGKPPIIHNKLYCDQIKIRLNKVNTNINGGNTPFGTHGGGGNLTTPTSASSSSSVLLKLKHDDLLKSVKSHTELAETANGVRMLARNLARATIQLDVRAIMIVTKARDNSLIYLTKEVTEWLLTIEREIIVFVDAKLKKLTRFDSQGLVETIPRAKKFLKYWDKSYALKNPEKIDLVVTLGGDGTVLYVSNLFQRVVPPVVSFSLGSLGFLTNFKFDQFREKMTQAVESGVRAYLRMRFTCRVHKANGKLVCEQQVLNELVVDRGPSPYVTQLELYGDGSLLTVAQADGLIIATPTGSTAYSLSAGGSLVHPGVSAISVTPICPHTLSFRPILLPDGMLLKVKVPKSSRSTAWASFDGKVRTELGKGDYVTIQASPFPFPTVILSKTDYIDSVSRNLNWNVREQQKPFASLKQQEQAAVKKGTTSASNGNSLHLDIGDFKNQLHIEDDTDCDGDSDCEAGICTEAEYDNDEDEDVLEEQDDEEFDIDDNDYSDTDEEEEAAAEEELERQYHESSASTNTTTSSAGSSDDEQVAYLPESGGGLSTPPPRDQIIILKKEHVLLIQMQE